MKKDVVKGVLFILPEKNKTNENELALPKGVAQAEEERRKIQDLQDVQIKLNKVAEVQKRLKELLESLAAKLEKCK
ncbi:MAG: hypothetical protein HYS98_07400 [Deltaproteobacteria bacterium]|nr:hypothetical protein [Deltaproteobacteria bacterium]